MASVIVKVLDDPFFEGREDLTLGLRAITPRVNVTSALTRVSIVDNEGNTRHALLVCCQWGTRLGGKYVKQ